MLPIFSTSIFHVSGKPQKQKKDSKSTQKPNAYLMPVHEFQCCSKTHIPSPINHFHLHIYESIPDNK